MVDVQLKQIVCGELVGIKAVAWVYSEIGKIDKVYEAAKIIRRQSIHVYKMLHQIIGAFIRTHRPAIKEIFRNILISISVNFTLTGA